MKISTFIMMLLFVGVVMFTVMQMVSEAETNYDIEINKTDWEGKYDYAAQVDEEIQPIKTSIDTIQNQDTGWLEKVGAGFTGIIKAVTFLPGLVWSAVTLSAGLFTGIGTAIGIPAYILLVIVIALSAWGIFKLIEFLQRWNV